MVKLEEVSEIIKIFDTELARIHAKRIALELELGGLMFKIRVLEDGKIKILHICKLEKKEPEDK